MHIELLYKNCIHIFVYDTCKIVPTQTQFVLKNLSGNVIIMEFKSLQLFQTKIVAINKTVYNRFFIQTICDRVHGDQYGYYSRFCLQTLQSVW